MRLLFVEDQASFVASKDAELSKKFEITVFDSSGFDTAEHADSDNAIESQIVAKILSMEESRGQFDVVLLDTDLSRFGGGISQSAFRAACSIVGLPVLRYSKKGLTQTSERLKYLATIAREGSQAILVPDSVLNEGLADWVSKIAASFSRIQNQIRQETKARRVVSPAELLAGMLGLPDIDIDLMGYSGANFFFFGDLIEWLDQNDEQVKDRRYATQLGYWLANYVLMFPGPILNEGATAAYLGISEGDMQKAEVLAVTEKALYRGPFSETGTYFIRRQLDNILLESDATSFIDLLEKSGINLEDSTTSNRDQLWSYCVVSNKPILNVDARGPFDWIPRGAEICRVDKRIYDKFGPWLNV